MTSSRFERMGHVTVEERARELGDQLWTILSEDGPGALAIAATSLRIADIASALEYSDRPRRASLFLALPAALAAEVLEEFPPEVRDELMEESSDAHLIDILNHADADDAIFFLDNLDEERAQALLRGIDTSLRTKLEEQFELPEDTAGHIMTRELVCLRRYMNVGQALEAVRESGYQEEIGIIYVVDADARLVGTLELRNLIFNPPRTPLANILDPDPLQVQLDTDREEVASLMQRYHLNAVAVVDANDHLCGQVTWDDAVDVIEAEANEDMMALAGSAEDLQQDETIFRRAWLRMPWLLITALGGFVMARMIHGESDNGVLGRFPLLMAFLPLVPALGGNIGIQASTVTVRSIATGEVRAGTILTRSLKEVATGTVLAVVLSCFCALGALIMVSFSADADHQTALIIGASLMIAVVVAASFGVVIPLACMRFNIDPAIAAGPFITMLNDITGVAIYLGTAGVLLNLLG